MKISYDWLQTYFDKPLPAPDKLADLFSLHFAEIEGVEKFGEGKSADTIFDIKTLADRNRYALSHRGVAGEASAAAKMPLKAVMAPAVAVDASVAKVAVKVDDSKLCPRYMARRIDGVRVSDSPKWLKDRLESIGARSINNVVDATNFVMFDIGQPLHAFDAAKIKGSIIVRPAKEGERIVLLDGREVALQPTDLLIADEEGPLVIAGVKGGKRAEVTVETKSIIIESANFDQTTVRRTSTRADIRNDSSKRFENGITPAIAEKAMAQVSALVQELSPGAKTGAVTDAYPNPVKPWTVEIDPEYMNAVTGLHLKSAEIADILTGIQCVVAKNGDKLSITPPLERLDLVIPEDIADEIGRMYGYDKLESKDTPDVPATPIDKTFYWAEKTKNALVAQGFSETLLYTLVPKGAFEISYPLASDKSALREKLAPKLKEALVSNARNADLLGLETIKIFEIGNVFPKSGEGTSLCIGVFQVKKKKGITAQSILQNVLDSQKLQAKIETGEFGAVAEIDFSALVEKSPEAKPLNDLDFKALPKDKRYVPFSPYPFIARDIALFVPSGTNDAEVASVIKTSASKAAGDLLVKGPDLFDRFEKDGKVSYAFRMIFQSFERTLSDEEANAFMAQIYAAAKSKNWEVR